MQVAKKKKKRAIVALLVVFGCVLAFHQWILCAGLELYIRHHLAKNSQLSVGSLERKGRALYLEKIQWDLKGSHLEIESLYFDCSFHWQQFSWHPRLIINQLQIQDESDSDEISFFPLAWLSKGIIQWDVQIEKGALLSPSLPEGTLYFTWKSEEDHHNVGSFYAYSDERFQEPAFLQVDFRWEQRRLVSSLFVRDCPLGYLFSLLSLQQSPQWQGWDAASGTVSGELEIGWDRDYHFEKVCGRVDLDDALASNEGLGVSWAMQSMKSSIQYPSAPDLSAGELPFWKKFDCFATLEGGMCSLRGSQLSLQNVLGEVRLQPGEDPFLKICGMLDAEGSAQPFSLEGKGEVQEEGTFWLQSQMTLSGARHQTELSCSICYDKLQTIVQMKASGISSETTKWIDCIKPWVEIPKFHVSRGEIGLEVVAFWDRSHLSRVEVLQCEGQEVGVQLPMLSLQAQAKSFTLEGVLTKKEAEWKAESFCVDLSGGSLFLEAEDAAVTNIALHLEAQNREMQSSFIEAAYRGAWGRIELLEKGAPHLVHLTGSIPCYDVLHRWLPGFERGWEGCKVAVEANLLSQEERSLLETHLVFEKKSEPSVHLDAVGSLEAKITHALDGWTQWKTADIQVDFITDRIGCGFLVPLFSFLPDTMRCQGGVALRGTVDRKGMRVESFASDLKVDLPEYAMSCAQETFLSADCDFRTGTWKGKIPVENMAIYDKARHLQGVLEDSLFFFEADQLWADCWNLSIGDLKVTGSLYLDSQSLQLVSHPMEGQISALAKIIPALQSHPLEGRFAIPKRGCMFQARKQQGEITYSWSAAGSVSQLAYFLRNGAKISDLQSDWELGSEGNVSLKNTKGRWQMGAMEGDLLLSNFSVSPQSTAPFSLVVRDEKREWLQCNGLIEQGKKISWRESYLLGIPFVLNSFSLEDFFLEGHANVSLAKLPFYLARCQDLCLIPGDISLQPMQEISGDLAVGFRWRKDRLDLQLESSAIAYRKQQMGALSCSIAAEGNRWKVDPCRLGEYQLQLGLLLRPEKWEITAFHLQIPSGKAQMLGEYSLKTGELSLKEYQLAWNACVGKTSCVGKAAGSFQGKVRKAPLALEGKGSIRFVGGVLEPMPWQISSTKACAFSIDTEHSCQLEEVQCDLTYAKEKAGMFSAKKVAFFFPTQRTVIGKGCYSCSRKEKQVLDRIEAIPSFIRNFFGMQACQVEWEADLSAANYKISGTLPEGSYFLGKTPWTCKQLRFLVDKNELYASCLTKWQQEPFWIQVRSSLTENPSLVVMLKEQLDQEGVVLQGKVMSGQFACDKIQGNFKGISLDLARERSRYRGRVSVDFEKAKGLLPASIAEKVSSWKIGKGYRCEGLFSLSPISFVGELVAEKFVIFGREFERASAQIDANAQKVAIEGLKVEDVIGFLQIKTLDFSERQGRWSFSAPLVYAKEVKPSLLQPKKKEDMAVIKNISIYEVQGILGDTMSLEGNGSLNFVTQNNKGFSFWDIPLSLIKDFGLDASLLTPTMGEVDFYFWGGKCHITDWRNSYSEGKRSQFFLAEAQTDPHLDFNGNWQLDLRMKQNVVWKITEDLIVSIRGNMAKPKYSLKKSTDAP